MHRLNRLAHASLVEIVRELCLELDIEDADALSPAVRKLKRVVALMPPLEDFVNQACSLVLSRAGRPGQPPLPPTASLSDPHVLERVLSMIADWSRELDVLGASQVRRGLGRGR